MIKKVSKATFVVASTLVGIPYAVAIFAQALYGWPRGRNKFRKALHPRRVYALNYAILQQLDNLRYAGLYYRWTTFYNNADITRLLRDIPFGSNGNTLDLYFPRDEYDHPVDGSKPVIVFIYGGTWSSGDKNMYGLLATEVADQTKAIVCCPNYSLYAKGYVDDMVQDVVDCLSWIHHNVRHYGGDGGNVMLIGHSAGAHLALMATIELIMKRLLQNPDAAIMSDTEVSQLTLSRQSSLPINLRQSALLVDSMSFHEQHFHGAAGEPSRQARPTSLPGEPKSISEIPSLGVSPTGSFCMVEKDKRSVDSFCVVGGENSGTKPSNSDTSENASEEEKKNGESNSEESVEKVAENLEKVITEEDEGVPQETKQNQESDNVDASETQDTTDSTIETQIQSPPVEQSTENQDTKEIEETKITFTEATPAEEEKSLEEMLSLTENVESETAGESALTRSQREARDILSSVRAIIGVAGVYHIEEHYEWETGRGVETISNMHRAMYGPEHFDRFSPTHIVKNLPKNTRFPAIHLIHGDNDGTVPTSSSTKFGEALWENGSRNVQVSIIPGCGHAEIVLDLMDRNRQWYDVVMSGILETVHQYLH